MNDEEYLQWMDMYKYFMNQAEFVLDDDMIRPMYTQSVLLIMNSMRQAAKSKDFVEMKKLLNMFKLSDPDLTDETKLLPIAQKYLNNQQTIQTLSVSSHSSQAQSSSFDANVCPNNNQI